MDETAVSPELLQRIAATLQSLQYGTVQITVHDARVVQIEKVERVRLAPAADLTTGRDSQHPPPHRTPGGERRTTGP